MNSFQILSPVDGKIFSTGSVIESKGRHSLDPASLIWVVLQDIFLHYYLQNPPVVLDSDGHWHAKNIHLGHDITRIIFVLVNTDGNEILLKKVKSHDWGAFDTLPRGTEMIGSVHVYVR